MESPLLNFEHKKSADPHTLTQVCYNLLYSMVKPAHKVQPQRV